MEQREEQNEQSLCHGGLNEGIVESENKEEITSEQDLEREEDVSLHHSDFPKQLVMASRQIVAYVEYETYIYVLVLVFHVHLHSEEQNWENKEGVEEVQENAHKVLKLHFGQGHIGDGMGVEVELRIFRLGGRLRLVFRELLVFHVLLIVFGEMLFLAVMEKLSLNIQEAERKGIHDNHAVSEEPEAVYCSRRNDYKENHHEVRGQPGKSQSCLLHDHVLLGESRADSHAGNHIDRRGEGNQHDSTEEERIFQSSGGEIDTE